MSTIEKRFLAVKQRVENAAKRVHRQPDEITLVAVTKTWPAETVLAAYQAGMREFGENRAEELANKRAEIEAALGRTHDITWHQIGTVQSRKTKLVAEHADCFHALDRVRIAQRLSRVTESAGKVLPVFVEVNISGEGSKAGFDCSNWEHDATQLSALRNGAEAIINLSGLRLQGVMTMAPFSAKPELIRSVFQRTRRLAGWLQIQFPETELSRLSMGMTDDFEIAIEEGATHVRVGRALFGSRTNPI